MTHPWYSSNDLVNFSTNKKFINESLVKENYDSNKHLCIFSHVPKTAGTSVESILAKNFLISEVLHVNAPDLVNMPEVIQLKKKTPKLICGHHPLHGLLYQLINDTPLFHFTLLRDPVDRVISYYNYVKGKQDHPMHAIAKSSSLLNFIKSNPSPELQNGQTKRFSGFLHHGTANDNTLYSKAKDVLDQCFSLVLTTDLFDQSLIILKNRLGLTDIYYQHKNVSKKFIHRNELDDATLNFIIETNQADILLYNWAENNLKTLVHAEVPEQDLKIFRNNNQKWQNLVD